MMKKIIFLILFFQITFSQYSDTTGFLFLRFPDPNSKIDFTKDKLIELPNKFHISFDIYFVRNEDFGFLFNLLSEEGDDFILSYISSQKQNEFKIRLYQRNFEKEILNINLKNVIEKRDWNKIDIYFDFASNYCSMTFNENKVEGSVKRIYSGNKFRFTMGEIEAVNSVVKELKIYQNQNDLIYYWPLNQENGIIVDEKIKNHFGFMSLGKWLREEHANFRLLNSIEINSIYNKSDFSNFNFNSNSDELIIFNFGEKLSYNLKNNQIEKIKIPKDWADYLIYDPYKNKYYRMLAGDDKVTVFNNNTLKWDNHEYKDKDNFRVHIFSKFINPLDSGLYIFGGYGFYKTYNDFSKYDFEKNIWRLIKLNGERIEPRNTTISFRDSTSLWFLGGHGNYTGEQSLKFKHFNDLWILDLKTNTLKKIYNFKELEKDSSILHYPITIPNDENLYCFKANKNKLTFVKISLKDFKITEICILKAKGISDAFYSKKLKKLFITENRVSTLEDRIDKINLYSITYPFIINKYLHLEDPWYKKIPDYWYLIFFVTLISVIISIFISSRNNKNLINVLPIKLNNKLKIETTKHPIKFFGGFSLLEKGKKEVGFELQERVKELFILLLINSSDKEGLTKVKLTNILWQGKSVLETKGNRGILILRLRKFLDKYEIGKIKVNSRHIYLELNKYKIDYNDFLELDDLVKNDIKYLSEEILSHYLDIVESGNFLAIEKFDWLDKIKNDVSEKVKSSLEIFTNFKMNENLLFRLSSAILKWDPTNEKGLEINIKFLKKNNKISEAKKILTTFASDFEKIKGNPFFKKLEDF